MIQLTKPVPPESIRILATKFCDRLGVSSKDLPVEFFQPRIRHKRPPAQEPVRVILEPLTTELERITPEEQAEAWERHPKSLMKLAQLYAQHTGELEMAAKLKQLERGLVQAKQYPKDALEKHARELHEATDTLNELAGHLEFYLQSHENRDIQRIERDIIGKDSEPQGKDMAATTIRLRETADWADKEFIPTWRKFAGPKQTADLRHSSQPATKTTR